MNDFDEHYAKRLHAEVARLCEEKRILIDDNCCLREDTLSSMAALRCIRRLLGVPEGKDIILFLQEQGSADRPSGQGE